MAKRTYNDKLIQRYKRKEKEKEQQKNEEIQLMLQEMRNYIPKRRK